MTTPRRQRRGALKLAAAILIALIGIAAIAFGVKSWLERTGETVVVSRIVDGDTIDVERSGETVRVRLLNIDTPEKEECLYNEATEHLGTLIAPGDRVTLIHDVERQDRYGRELAGVVAADGTFINEVMVADGFARAVEYQPNTRFTRQMRDAEAQAKAANTGIHAVPTECLLPTEVALDALRRYQTDPDPFYLDVMRDAVDSTNNFTYRDQAIALIDSL